MNNAFFDDGDVREGSEVDEQMSPSLFTQLGFKVSCKITSRDGKHSGCCTQFQCHVHVDQSENEMMLNVQDFAHMPEHEEGEMCVVIMMSHGSKDALKSRDGLDVSVSSLLDMFTATNCPSLARKPKLFIIQSCR